jgi:hypothetical protein
MVVEHLSAECEDKNIGIAYIYLNHKEADDQTPSKLLAGLWRQLVLDKDVAIFAKKLYQRHREKRTTPSLEEVFDVLHSSFAGLSKVYIIVDAIDEYPEVQRRILLKYLAAMGPSINLMVTSRPHIYSPLPNLETLDIRATREDIRAYVDAQIDFWPRLSKHVQSQPELREDIHSKISSRTVDGM